MIALLIIPVLLIIIAAGYLELTSKSRGTGRPRRQVMHLVSYSEAHDSGFAG